MNFVPCGRLAPSEESCYKLCPRWKENMSWSILSPFAVALIFPCVSFQATIIWLTITIVPFCLLGSFRDDEISCEFMIFISCSAFPYVYISLELSVYLPVYTNTQERQLEVKKVRKGQKIKKSSSREKSRDENNCAKIMFSYWLTIFIKFQDYYHY